MSLPSLHRRLLLRSQQHLLLRQPILRQSLLRSPAAFSTSRPLRSSLPASKFTGANTVDIYNGPASTLPSEIKVKRRKEFSSTFSYLFAAGKLYITFFKDGLKAVFKNFKAAQPIQDRVDAERTLLLAVKKGKINRSELQLLVRSKHDIVRLPAFGLLLIVLGEFSVFVLPFVSGIVPFNCRIPKQLERERRLVEERRKAALESFNAQTDLRKNAAIVLGVVKHTWAPGFWCAWRLRRRLQYLVADDAAMLQGGGEKVVNGGEELRMACQDRGIDVLGRGDGKLRMDLKAYFRVANLETMKEKELLEVFTKSWDQWKEELWKKGEKL